MIKYFVNEDKRQVIAVLENTKWDAFNKIEKMMADTEFCLVPCEKYTMPSQFKVVVTCDPRDEFDVEVGKKIAKKRVLKNYYASLDKRIGKFHEACLVFNGKVFKTPEALENNT
jgi:hypothetical protein